MTKALVLWDDVPTEQRTDEAPSGWRSIWRGCAAACAWPGGRWFWRCAAAPLREHGLCRTHAIRAGLLPPPPPQYPHGLKPAVGNLILRSLRDGSRMLTVAEFRALAAFDILSWPGAGQMALPVIQQVQQTWSDDELIAAFGLRARPWDASGDVAVCNWVGEGP